MEMEGFTFPITTNNTTSKLFIDSKPWWRVTYSSSSSEKSENKEAEDLESCFGRKNFEDMKGGALKVGNDDDNMDLLWEELNEERIWEEADMPSMRMSGLGCGGAFKLVKSGGCRKPGAAVVIKVLKKLLPQNSRTSVNRSSW